MNCKSPARSIRLVACLAPLTAIAVAVTTAGPPANEGPLLTGSEMPAVAAAPDPGSRVGHGAAPRPWRDDQVQKRSEIAWPVVIDGSDLGEVHRVILAGDPHAIPFDDPGSRIDPNSAGSPYSGICSLLVTTAWGTGMCTGTPIGPRHILTAGHCFDWNDDGLNDAGTNVTVIFNADGDQSHVIDAIDVEAVFVHPEFSGFAQPVVNDDLAIIVLADPLPSEIPVYLPFRGALADGEIITLVGYGQSGNGIDGLTVAASQVVKRSGANAADAFLVDDDEPLGPLEVWLADFDSPDASPACQGGPTLGNDIETAVGPGDSGGPSLVEVDGELQVWGVNTFGSSCAGPTFHFGARSGGLAVNAYLAWIDTVVECNGNCDDCNGNGVFDGLDIAAGDAADTDGNGIPDECQVLVPGDIWFHDGVNDLMGFSIARGQLMVVQPTSITSVRSAQVRRDGLLYLCARIAYPASSGVYRFDAATGEPVDTFIDESDGVSYPVDLAEGPDGLLYVLNRGAVMWGEAFVTRHDPVTGALLDVFIEDDPTTPETENGGITLAAGIEFGPDGMIYCTDMGLDLPGVARFDGQTGAFLGYAATTAPATHPGANRALAFRDGMMYVGNVNSGDTYRFDVATGAFIDEFIPGINETVGVPVDFEWGIDGDLYMAAAGGMGSSLLHFDPDTGMLIENLLTTVEGMQAIGQVPVFEDIDGDGVVNAADLGLLLGAWGPCGGCPEDLDGNDIVDGADLGILLAAWTP